MVVRREKAPRPRYRTVGETIGPFGMEKQTYESLNCICWVLTAAMAITALSLSIYALVLATKNTDAILWSREAGTDDIVSDVPGDVRARGDFTTEGDGFTDGDLTVTGNIQLDAVGTATDGLRKISFSPAVIGPTGDDTVLGDTTVPYARVESLTAIGFRVATDDLLAPSGILFGEPDLKMFIEAGGVSIATASTPYFGTFIPSDDRIKTNETDLPSIDALSHVLSLVPKTFYYLESWVNASTGAINGSVPSTGFIAQELATVLPTSIRQTSILINDTEVDDFNTYRLEDLLPQIVGAIHDLAKSQGTQIGRSYCLDPFSATPYNVTTEAADFCNCTSAAYADQLSCLCTELDAMCVAVSNTFAICADSDPLKRACGIAGFSGL